MFTTVGSMVTVSPGVRDVRCPDTNKISGTYLFSLTVDVFLGSFSGGQTASNQTVEDQRPPLKINFTSWEGFSALQTACIHPCIHHVYYASEGYF